MIVISNKKKNQKASSRQTPSAPPKPQIRKMQLPKPPIEKPSYKKPTYEAPVYETPVSSQAARQPRNAAERYEEWFPVPEGKTVIRCRYCGADNLILRGRHREQYTCYFCREEL